MPKIIIKNLQATSNPACCQILIRYLGLFLTGPRLRKILSVLKFAVLSDLTKADNPSSSSMLIQRTKRLSELRGEELARTIPSKPERLANESNMACNTKELPGVITTYESGSLLIVVNEFGTRTMLK